MTKENQTQPVSGAMTDEQLIEAVEHELGFGSGAWDMVEPLKIARAFRKALLSRAPDAQAVRNAALEEAAKLIDQRNPCLKWTLYGDASAIRALQSNAQPVERPDAVELPPLPRYAMSMGCMFGGEMFREYYTADQLREYALEAIAANQPQQEKQGWYCANCGKGVPPEEVTYSEHHTLCGGPVGGWPPQRGNAQERWVDTRCVELDRSILMGPSYDWDGWECSRIEMHTPHASFAVWPHQLGGKQRWSMYCNRGGLLIFERFATAEAAKAEAEMVAESIAATVAAPQVAQVEGARDEIIRLGEMLKQAERPVEVNDYSSAPQSDAQQSGKDVDALIASMKAFADAQYVAGCRVADSYECKGWEAKVQSGRFGKAEMDAHAKMQNHFGAHSGIYAAINAALAKEQGR